MNLHKILFLLLCVQYIAPHQPKVVLVEGNIGVGKTTFMNMLGNYFDQAGIVYESVHEWQDIHGHNLLDAFYKDGSRWACLMQLYVTMVNVKTIQTAFESNKEIYFMERSWYSTRFAFATNAFLMGLMNEMEWYLFADTWDWYVQQAPRPIGIIYIQTDPEVCYERMKARGRSEESIVPLDYLKMLHDRHEEWLIEEKYKNMGNIPVLVIDGMRNFRDDRAVQQEIISQILDFLKKQENTIFTM